MKDDRDIGLSEGLQDPVEMRTPNLFENLWMNEQTCLVGEIIRGEADVEFVCVGWWLLTFVLSVGFCFCFGGVCG